MKARFLKAASRWPPPVTRSQTAPLAGQGGIPPTAQEPIGASTVSGLSGEGVKIAPLQDPLASAVKNASAAQPSSALTLSGPVAIPAVPKEAAPLPLAPPLPSAIITIDEGDEEQTGQALKRRGRLVKAANKRAWDEAAEDTQAKKAKSPALASVVERVSSSSKRPPAVPIATSS